MSAPSLCIAPSTSAAGLSPLRFLIHAILWFAGVILPLAALTFAIFVMYVVGVEPPFIMLVQILSIVIVPVANGLLLQALGSGRPAPSRRLGHAHGFATGISVLLSLLFLPHLGTGVAILFDYGAGLLLLAPLLSLLAAMAMRRLLAPSLPLPSAWSGVLLALAIIVAPELPQAVNQAGVHMLASKEAATSANGLSLLRYLGNQKILLCMCGSGNDHLASVTDLVMLATTPTSNTAACEALYRISGVRHDAVPDMSD